MVAVPVMVPMIVVSVMFVSMTIMRMRAMGLIRGLVAVIRAVGRVFLIIGVMMVVSLTGMGHAGGLVQC